MSHFVTKLKTMNHCVANKKFKGKMLTNIKLFLAVKCQTHTWSQDGYKQQEFLFQHHYISAKPDSFEPDFSICCLLYFLHIGLYKSLSILLFNKYSF